MPELVIDGDRRMIVARAFRLAFTWNGDRWTHALEHLGRGREAHRTLASSFEGDAARDDLSRVVSPAYQDLQFQESESGLMALLVGQSGPHHFSAVFEVEEGTVANVVGRNPSEPVHEVIIKVDIADRCRAPVRSLASTYVVEAQSGDLDAGSDSSVVSWKLESDDLAFSPEAPALASFAEAGRRATRVQACVTPEPGSATHRLIYHWIWQQNLLE
jgi:hypothetical protein